MESIDWGATLALVQVVVAVFTFIVLLLTSVVLWTHKNSLDRQAKAVEDQILIIRIGENQKIMMALARVYRQGAGKVSPDDIMRAQAGIEMYWEMFVEKEVRDKVEAEIELFPEEPSEPEKRIFYLIERKVKMLFLEESALRMHIHFGAYADAYRILK